MLKITRVNGFIEKEINKIENIVKYFFIFLYFFIKIIVGGGI